MTEITPAYRGAAVEDASQKASVPAEAQKPAGRPVTSVQPHPVPLIYQPEQGAPRVDDQDRRLHQAQLRAEVTGLGGVGGIVDIRV